VVGAGAWLHGLAGLIASLEQERSISAGAPPRTPPRPWSKIGLQPVGREMLAVAGQICHK
jgi:hypothetical protein